MQKSYKKIINETFAGKTVKVFKLKNEWGQIVYDFEIRSVVGYPSLVEHTYVSESWETIKLVSVSDCILSFKFENTEIDIDAHHSPNILFKCDEPAQIKYTMILLKNCSAECNGKMISPHVCKFYPDGSISVNFVEYYVDEEYDNMTYSGISTFKSHQWETIELTAEPVNHTLEDFNKLRNEGVEKVRQLAINTFVYDGEFEVVTEKEIFEEFKKMYLVHFPHNHYDKEAEIQRAFCNCLRHNDFKYCDKDFYKRVYAHHTYDKDRHKRFYENIEKVKAEHGFTPDWDKMPETFIYDKTNFNLSQTILNNK